MLPPLTPVVKNLLIVNTLIFLAQVTFQGKYPVNEMFAQHHFLSKDFRPHQLLTGMFMHGSWGHLFGNMLGLYIFGSKLELVWGSKRFLTYYMICGIGAALTIGLVTLIQTYPSIADVNLLMQDPSISNFNMLYNKYGLETVFENGPQVYANLNANPTSPETRQAIFDSALTLKNYFTSGTVVGASGALYGIIIAAGYLFPDDLVYFYFFVPVKMKWIAIGYTAIALYSAIQANPNDPVAHVAHLGGAAIGFLILFFSYRRGGRNKLF